MINQAYRGGRYRASNGMGFRGGRNRPYMEGRGRGGGGPPMDRMRMNSDGMGPGGGFEQPPYNMMNGGRMPGPISGGQGPEDQRSPRGPQSGGNRQRPLARLTARAMNVRGPITLGQSANAYRMEVNEVFLEGGDREAGPIPCVTIRDYMRITEESVSQRRVCIPVAVVDNLARLVNRCLGDNGAYNAAELEAQKLTCPKTKKVVEVIVTPEGKRLLRSYLNVPTLEEYKSGDPQEIIEIRSELMKRMYKFLHDVATRYRNVKGEMNVPSLFSYSGERRYYFDLRRTRWGLRLHVSQVTDMHRNVVGIPLESLVTFRDRLNSAISFLRLEDEAPSAASGGPSSDGKASRGTRRTGTSGKTALRKRKFNRKRDGTGKKESNDDKESTGGGTGDENSAGDGSAKAAAAKPQTKDLEEAMSNMEIKTNGVTETD